MDHANRVVEGRSRKWLPKSDLLRASLENIVECPDLDGALHAEMRRCAPSSMAFSTIEIAALAMIVSNVWRVLKD